MTDKIGKLPGYLLKPAAPPAPRPEQLVNEIENEIGTMVAKQQPQPRRAIGNSSDMARIQELVSNAITAAHDDTGKALDKVLEEARGLLNRITAAVEQHKKTLQEQGQKIAADLESTVQELKRTCEWVEKQGPNLRSPTGEKSE
jgi:ABC-type transporter Mla subunit MlaD